MLAEKRPGLLLHFAQVKQEFLLLIPEAAVGDVFNSMMTRQLPANVSEISSAQKAFQTHVRDQVECVPRPLRYHIGQSRRTLNHGLTVLALFTKDFTGLETSVFKAHHGSSRGLQDGVGPWIRQGFPWLGQLIGRVEIETDVFRQFRGLFDLLDRIPPDFLDQLRERVERRFFFSP